MKHYKLSLAHRQAISKAHKKSGLKPPTGFMEKASNWKGGRIKRVGYWYIKSLNHPNGGKQGYVAEHRIVMEKHLGRFLNPQEAVHHINGIITDNRIENLKLYATHGQHTKEAHPEIRIKSSIANKGKRRSPRTEFKKGENLGNTNGFKKGNIPWNKGNCL